MEEGKNFSLIFEYKFNILPSVCLILISVLLHIVIHFFLLSPKVPYKTFVIYQHVN